MGKPVGEIEIGGVKFFSVDVPKGKNLADCEGCEFRKTPTCLQISCRCHYGKIWKRKQ